MVAGPNSLQSIDIKTHLHPYTNLSELAETGPLVIVRGEGVRVIDSDGKSYLEGMAGLWCASLGFSNRRLAAAAAHQMEVLPFYHTFFGRAPEVTVRLAEALVEITPAPLTKAFFANSGSEANDTAIKLAWYYNNALGRPEKKKIISRLNAYHGVTIATASLTAIPVNQVSFDLPIDRILHTDCPHHYRYAETGESEEAFATRLADSLDALVRHEGPETIAAFIAEPIMAAGGVIVPPRTYFDKIQRVLKKYDILFIVDEVVCGFGRTGRMFGAETFDVDPDMMTMAKGLSAAYQPISALMVSEKIYEAVRKESGRIGIFGHGFTYSGHPVPAAVALETLNIYREERIVEHVQSVAPRFERHLAALMEHSLVGEARGKGLIGAVEIVQDKATKESFDPAAGAGAIAFRAALDHGLMIRQRGDTLMMCPPIVITEAEIDELFEKLAAALDDTAKVMD